MRLGITNVLLVGFYRTLIKYNLHSVQRISEKKINGNFFKYQNTPHLLVNRHKLYNYKDLVEGFSPFSNNWISFKSNYPNWHKNYINGKESKLKNEKWWKINDFDDNIGDIKCVWELSRFDWVIKLSMLGASGEKKAINLLNKRLNHWINNNQPYNGINWKCGQEASIRVMHLIMSAIILKQHTKSLKPLTRLIEIHLKRIKPTIFYAIGQENNHGTSEAAALFCGGHFLYVNGLKKYKRYSNIGRKWIENRSNKLFSNDGCFSQYSVNYHRLVLDTYSFIESYRLINNLPRFSSNLYSKLIKATEWLEILLDSNTGKVPNIGANDGSLLFPFFKKKYNDYRPSVQWANLVFKNQKVGYFDNDDLIFFESINIISEGVKYKNVSFIDNKIILGNNDGFFIFRKKKILLVFRRPVFKFRPSHADVFHIDLTVDGENFLRDGGSFSYNTDYKKIEYYNGVQSHNTISFDDRNQMNKISRFLYSSWLKEDFFYHKDLVDYYYIKSSYTDNYGSRHARKIYIYKNHLKVIDAVENFKNFAKIKWRLNPIKWSEKKYEKTNKIEINFKSNQISGDFFLKMGSESKLYNTESKITEIYKKIKYPSKFTTTIKW